MPESPQSASLQISQPNSMALRWYLLQIHLIIVINVDITVNNIINVINSLTTTGAYVCQLDKFA
jgi:hypothetical protein